MRTSKEKVYCKNCKYFRRHKRIIKVREKCLAPNNLKKSSDYYSTYKEDIDYAQELNEKNKCKLYKKKWWKFGVKENKRKTLKGSQPKTKAGPKPEIIPSITLEKYLDKAITKWRNELGISKTKEDKLIAKCNIDSYQSVRISMLGELKPKEEK